MKVDIMMNRLKFLKSMSFGILLLVLILILSAIGTVLPQGESPQFYTEHYSEYISELILIFDLHRIYTSLLFAGLFTALAVNLLLCSTIRLGKIISGRKRHVIGSELAQIGSWFLHLGIMLVILFYIYGQATFFSGEVYGVPGESMSLADTGYRAVIEGFDVSYREDGTVSQYTTDIKLLDSNGGLLLQDTLNVNNPLRYDGYSFYQTSMGWAVDCNILKDGKALKSEILYEKSASIVPNEKIAIAFTKFYPDFAANERGFLTLSDQPNNPALLYAVYYRDELVKMDIAKPGEAIKWNEFGFELDHVRRYTYLKVNKMRGQMGAAVGGMLLLIGLALNFYFKPKQAIQPEDTLYLNKKEEGINVK